MYGHICLIRGESRKRQKVGSIPNVLMMSYYVGVWCTSPPLREKDQFDSDAYRMVFDYDVLKIAYDTSGAAVIKVRDDWGSTRIRGWIVSCLTCFVGVVIKFMVFKKSSSKWSLEISYTSVYEMDVIIDIEGYFSKHVITDSYRISQWQPGGKLRSC